MSTRTTHNYNKDRPYRTYIAKIQKEEGYTTFTNKAQFWTLGGPEHHEFTALNKLLKFENESYHTVDRGPMAHTNNKAIVVHQNTEFTTIPRFWKGIARPLVISYDSTEVIYDYTNGRNGAPQKAKDLVRLAACAVHNNHNKYLFFHLNLMQAYPRTKRLNKKDVFYKDDYQKWVEMFVNYSQFKEVKVYDGYTERMEGSRTDMVSMHFRITC